MNLSRKQVNLNNTDSKFCHERINLKIVRMAIFQLSGIYIMWRMAKYFSMLWKGISIHSTFQLPEVPIIQFLFLIFNHKNCLTIINIILLYSDEEQKYTTLLMKKRNLKFYLVISHIHYSQPQWQLFSDKISVYYLNLANLQRCGMHRHIGVNNYQPNL